MTSRATTDRVLAAMRRTHPSLEDIAELVDIFGPHWQLVASVAGDLAPRPAWAARFHAMTYQNTAAARVAADEQAMAHGRHAALRVAEDYARSATGLATVGLGRDVSELSMAAAGGAAVAACVIDLVDGDQLTVDHIRTLTSEWRRAHPRSDLARAVAALR